MLPVNAVLLGSPLFPEGIPSEIDEKIAGIKLAMDRLSILEPRQALYLLKNCLGALKILYVLRTAPVWLYPERLKTFDDMVRDTLSSITNIHMTEDVWRQATLSVGHGGLGIRQVAELALPAFLASVHVTKSVATTVFFRISNGWRGF